MTPLPPSALYRPCDAGQFTFATTSEICPDGEPLLDLPGQERAIAALRFGVGIRHQGYNLFALGPTGLGKHRLIRQLLSAEARGAAGPPEWCYINNFTDSQKPRALSLPRGRGLPWKKDMERLVEELRVAIPAAFESEDFRSRKALLDKELQARHEQTIAELQRRAEERGIAVLRTPVGLALGPLQDPMVTEDEDNELIDESESPESVDSPGSGDAAAEPAEAQPAVMAAKDYGALSEEERQRIEQGVTELQAELQAAIQEIPRWQREIRDKERQLGREVIAHAAAHLFEELTGRYEDLPQVLEHLAAIQKDLGDRVELFLPDHKEEDEEEEGFGDDSAVSEDWFRAYRVNVLTPQEGEEGAPVIYEDHPTHPNLVGRVEHQAQFGALVTDFNLIRPGALHRANGGYLILDAHKLLEQPGAWDELKRALRSRKVKIETAEQAHSVASTVSLEPEPIPLSVKVVLLGEPLLYYTLIEEDPDFSALFKVAADFAEEVARTPDNDQRYAKVLAQLARQSGLLPLYPDAVARTIEHAARIIGDGERLSTHLRSLTDLLCEADFFSRELGQPAITAAHVQLAIDAQVRRGDRMQVLGLEDIQRGTILIDTVGEVVGQVNGLTVMELGQLAFGRPVRITARVRLGRGEVVDIERAVELGGPIHSKGVLILQSYLGARYSQEQPLCLSASLVLEQSYSGVEGDSASMAELCALLSALAEAPARQALAVTGSVNQLGQVQAVGGINEKIEGFFDLCVSRGLSGDQGVLIPAGNVKNLMLRRDVVEAAAAGLFRIFPITTVDEGLELLCGQAAGARQGGHFPEGTLNHRIEARLRRFAERARSFALLGAEEVGIARIAG